MLAQPVTPLLPGRLVTALGALAEDVHSSPEGSHLVPVGGELIRVEHLADRPFALTVSLEWRRRLPMDHSANIRAFVDESNREIGLARTSVAVTDSGHLRVVVAATHLVIGGISDAQLAGWLERGIGELLDVVETLDDRFPEPHAGGGE